MGERTYEVRFYDARGKLKRTHVMECEHDDEAIGRVAALNHAHALELWQGARLVWRFETRAR